jgi:hypothetical protein
MLGAQTRGRTILRRVLEEFPLDSRCNYRTASFFMDRWPLCRDLQTLTRGCHLTDLKFLVANFQNRTVCGFLLSRNTSPALWEVGHFELADN